MWRALSAFVVLMIAVGVYAVVTGGFAPAAAPPEEATGPATTDFGFALAAGAVALGATIMLSRPRFRYRR